MAFSEGGGGTYHNPSPTPPWSGGERTSMTNVVHRWGKSRMAMSARRADILMARNLISPSLRVALL
eukprot:CAMPEP_0194119900 /NCGR_PEP_ID=MMETSP0150-20130528/41150_1 /TAXON_ID=122233 /ORGANISM="Chaetoceros debilis, Strain MM31A-1" /LENGTH=65 /DNA_ID=CAMNT_0038811759 /DNA_START=40 /DNA_END=234 /DNA_ORIENTATION=-